MIVFDDVSVNFAGKVVLKNFSIEVQPGDKVVFQGKSGIGKSTLFRLVLGFTRPSAGNILFEDEPIDKCSVWKLRRRIAYVSQDLDIGEGTVREVIEQAFAFKANLDSPDRETELAGLLQYFEMTEDILDEDFSDLSGGEKQRTAIIIAVLLGRDIFLLDEITSALDDAMKEKVINYFLDRKDWTVLAISHDREWEHKNVRRVKLEVS